jgi:signal transduction histidine kinase
MHMSTGLRPRTWKLAVLYAGIVGISILHYLTPTSYMWLHPLYASAYYFPLIVIALTWGWRAGLAAACLTTILYTPHVLHAWAGEHEEYMVSQLIEMAMFLAVTVTAGILADYERRQRKRIEETAVQLARLNRQLSDAFEQLHRSERLSTLGELAAGLAHEIRNPLGSVEGALRIVSRPQLPDETRQEFSTLALSEAERLKGLVSSFLDFARSPASHRIPTSSQHLLISIERLVAETASMSGVKVHTQAHAELPEILVDPQQIKQVLLNLALNAIQAMPNGGNLILEAKVDGQVVIFEVQDEGVGIAEENIGKIFDPFYTTRPNGTGLGLSIAKRIVTEHGGRIQVRRNSHRGMSFSIELPYRASSAATTSASEEAVPSMS